MEARQRLANPLLHYGILLLIYGTGALTLLTHTVFHSFHEHDHAAAAVVQAEPCTGIPSKSHRLAVTAKGMVPATVIANRCDTLTVINDIYEPVTAALGPHEHHIAYPGFAEKLLNHGQSYTFTLSEAGEFPIHDHDNEGLRADLVVNN